MVVEVVPIESGIDNFQLAGDGPAERVTLQWRGELSAATQEAGARSAVRSEEEAAESGHGNPQLAGDGAATLEPAVWRSSEAPPIVLAQRGPLQPPGPQLAPGGQAPRGSPPDPADLAGPHVRRIQFDQFILGYQRLDAENAEMRQRLGDTGPSVRMNLGSRFGHIARGGLVTDADLADVKALHDSAKAENDRLRAYIETPEGQSRIQAESERLQREVEGRERERRLQEIEDSTLGGGDGDDGVNG